MTSNLTLTTFNKAYRICPSVVFFLTSSLFAIEPPKEPVPPTVELAEKTPEHVSKDSKKEKNLKTAAVTVKLCDGRQVSGTVEYEKDVLFLQHIKEGIKYEKKMRITEIKQIKIISWELKKGKKTKDGYTYQASPLKVQITSNNAETFQIKGLKDTEFQNLSLSNENGVAKLYTYWMDLQYDNGTWYSKLGTTSNTEREECHFDVVRVIQFN